MSEEKPTKEEQLYVHLVSTFTQSAWIALGKVKNPVTDEILRNLEEASFYIDLLDMIKSKMKGNLSDWEERFLDSSIGNLKLNYVDEMKKAEQEATDKSESEIHREGKEEEEAEGKKEPGTDSGKKAQTKPRRRKGKKGKGKGEEKLPGQSVKNDSADEEEKKNDL